ncbi:amidotransferase 1, exosortase A system-associated [Sphingorhabdus sp. IMCC26285]|uniref:asparagine synthase (glutamine-hydrolyzing) n=1 Tax=Sphingorhabdus profundilacus TaxID=2509718 RepID=A0A6I4LVY4_9SPHN|nr:XrtA/PEP-CTERM system amidotransferase [Sphingorhabdus profundilacus]MVZ97522.1 amidotransferase 1, exosortase A system-associated [Sphingorhabdus profundilacus]
MCGIAGIFHIETAKPVDPDRVKRMTDAIAHRGPDGSGVWTAPGVGLGHRRLSIIDLEGGAQPMHSDDGALSLTFNGEIYNFRELRKELEAAGYSFATQSDSEVILHGWRHWGPACVSHFLGMFVFAIFDARTKQLFLARDRLGVKPLFYAAIPDGSILFGSELKALTAHPALRREIDLSAVDDYLAFGYVPDHSCIVRGVKKLAAGHYLLLQLGNAIPSPTQYWDLDFSKRVRGSQGELSEELLRLMRQGVTSRMVADVPLGAFLSGGVDSSSVVALMAEASRQPIKTCSIGFDVGALDESEYAETIARRFATDHRSRKVAADDFGLIDKLAHHFDEPFADASALPTYRVCELAREQVTVALSGDGADEALAGYRRHVFHHKEEQLRGLLPQNVRGPLFGTLGKFYPKADWAPRPLRAKTTLLSLARTGPEGYTDAVSLTSANRRHRLYSQHMRGALDGYRGETYMENLMTRAPAQSGLDQAQYADMKMWLPGDILTKVDRTSMAVGLEAREPLLDHRLLEFAASLPDRMRIRGGQGKWLMKKTMEGHLPHDILYRPKMGFVTPIDQWFRGALADDARALSTSRIFSQMDLFDSNVVAKAAEDHIAGRVNNGRLLWQLVMLEKSLAGLFG